MCIFYIEIYAQKRIIIIVKRKANHLGGKKMTKLAVAAITESGCHVYTELNLKEDYTMNQVVNEVKRLGYVSFRLTATMRTYVKVR